MDTDQFGPDAAIKAIRDAKSKKSLNTKPQMIRASVLRARDKHLGAALLACPTGEVGTVIKSFMEHDSEVSIQEMIEK